MRKPDALAGLVLGSGAAEQLEDALMISRVDAAAVVDHLENRETELGAAADQNIAGDAGSKVFQRIVDQVGEDLLQRKAIADEVRQRLHPDMRFGFRGLVR